MGGQPREFFHSPPAGHALGKLKLLGDEAFSHCFMPWLHREACHPPFCPLPKNKLCHNRNSGGSFIVRTKKCVTQAEYHYMIA